MSNPGIYGPLVGGGTMAPPPVMGPGLAPAGGSDPSWWDVPGQIEKAIDTWFGNLVKSALEPVLRLIGNTLLASPDVSDGRIAQVWTGVLITTNTLYVLFVLAGAVIVMGHETVQTRHSLKQIAPRLVLGIVASNASLWAISQTVSLGNALAAALTNGKLSAEGIGSRLTSMIVDKIFLPSGITQLFLVLLGGAIAVLGIVLLVTCLIRAAVLLTLTAGAPLALACHALPQTDPLAKLWWRAIIGCLATQVAQALVLIICVQVFFDPNADTILGLPSGGGLVDLLLCLVLLFVLIKIPIWTTRIVLGRRPFGSTTAGYMIKSAITWKAFGWAKGRLGGPAAASPAEIGGLAQQPPAAAGAKRRFGPVPRAEARWRRRVRRLDATRRDGHRHSHREPRRTTYLSARGHRRFARTATARPVAAVGARAGPRTAGFAGRPYGAAEPSAPSVGGRRSAAARHAVRAVRSDHPHRGQGAEDAGEADTCSRLGTEARAGVSQPRPAPTRPETAGRAAAAGPGVPRPVRSGSEAHTSAQTHPTCSTATSRPGEERRLIRHDRRQTRLHREDPSERVRPRQDHVRGDRPPVRDPRRHRRRAVAGLARTA